MATQRRQPDRSQHILLLGASGLSGLAFIQEHLSIANDDNIKPFLTLYVRGSGRSKLTPFLPNACGSSNPAPKIRIVEGELNDRNAVREALSGDGDFPKVTTVISVLGAYMSVYYLLTRQKPTPIADALGQTIIPVMRELDINRVLVLSTSTAFPVSIESKQMSWNWYFHNLLPAVMVPQGNAEMKAIAHAVLDNSSEHVEARHGLEATAFRVPFLTDGAPDLEVAAFLIGGEGNTENTTLSRRSMVRWLMRETRERKWINGAPMLCNLGSK